MSMDLVYFDLFTINQRMHVSRCSDKTLMRVRGEGGWGEDTPVSGDTLVRHPRHDFLESVCVLSHSSRHIYHFLPLFRSSTTYMHTRIGRHELEGKVCIMVRPGH